VESTEALENLDDITEAADGIMVARGDLGVEVPLEEVVIWQKEMVERCVAQASGKPVIVATQMLESMQKNPRPTRAEVSDVTNAVLDGADAVMLSGESANGKFPVESVEMMSKIIEKTESWMPPIASVEAMMDDAESKEDAMAASAVFTSEKLAAGCIVVKGDDSGDVSRLVSKYRPSSPILLVLDGVKHGQKVARQTSLHRGVFPTLLNEAQALAAAKEQGLFEAGDDLVSITVHPASGSIGMSIDKAK
jgi:pyruvate kinase